MKNSSMTWSIRIAFCFLIVLSSSPASILATNANNNKTTGSFELIEHDYLSGNIDKTEKLVQEMTALFAPESLPDKYKSTNPSYIKSGTQLIMSVRDNWDSFSSDEQNLLANYLYRPDMDTAYISPEGFVKIHYDTIGSEGVSPVDADSNSIPDYVDRIALYADSALRTYTVQWGYYPPVDDGDGDSAYDIYLVSIAAYGATVPENPGDSAWNDYSSYTMIHFTMGLFGPNDDPEGDTVGAQKVTCAHELYHAVQLAYDYDMADNLWWMEAGATAMEECLFPVVNDNFSYLPYFFNFPYDSLHSSDTYHMYGAFVWPLFLDKKFDVSIQRDIWSACRYNLPLISTDSALVGYGESITSIFPEFTVWNYFTGTRAITGKYYDDADRYPEVNIDQSYDSLLHDSLQPINSPDGLGCNYYQFAVDPSVSGILEIRLEGSNLVRWGLSAIYETEGGFDTVQTIFADWGLKAQLYLPYIEDYDTVVIIPAVVSYHHSENPYYLSTILIPYGDANYDYDVNVGDATYIINYSFKGGPPPVPIIESGDANCDGGVNIGDAVTILNYVFKHGSPPCSGR